MQKHKYLEVNLFFNTIFFAQYQNYSLIATIFLEIVSGRQSDLMTKLHKQNFPQEKKKLFFWLRGGRYSAADLRLGNAALPRHR